MKLNVCISQEKSWWKLEVLISWVPVPNSMLDSPIKWSDSPDVDCWYDANILVSIILHYAKSKNPVAMRNNNNIRASTTRWKWQVTLTNLVANGTNVRQLAAVTFSFLDLVIFKARTRLSLCKTSSPDNILQGHRQCILDPRHDRFKEIQTRLYSVFFPHTRMITSAVTPFCIAKSI